MEQQSKNNLVGKINQEDFTKFQSEFEKNGYFFNNTQSLIAAYLADRYYELPRKGLSGILLTGEPGVGKTHFAESLAKVDNAELLEYQCVASTTDEQLYATINTVGLVKKENPVSDGILVRAIKNANEGKKTILLVDEIDKGNENIDPYFLTFFQKGAIWTPDHGEVAIKDECRDNLIVVVCKNKWRELDGSLLRRLRRIDLELPTIESMSRIIAFNDNGFNSNMKSIALKLYGEMLNAEKGTFTRITSAQEIINALNDDIIIEMIGGNAHDRIMNLISWFANNPEDRQEIKKIFADREKFSYDVDKTKGSATLSHVPFFNLNENEINQFIRKTKDLEVNLQEIVSEALKNKGIEVYDLPQFVGYVKVDSDGDMYFRQDEEVRYLLESLEEELNYDKTIDEDNIHVLANDSDFIAAVQLNNHYLLFIPEDTSYISAKSVLHAFASLYSISRGNDGAQITRTVIEENGTHNEVLADVITYDNNNSHSLTRGKYRKY